MASRGYAPLPAYQYGNAMVNFQPLTQAVDKYRAGMDAKYEGDAQREFANAMASGDYQAAQAAIGKVDPKLAMEAGMYPGKRATQDIDLRMKEAKELGGRAQSILDMPDGPEKIAAANQWFQSDPRFQATFQKRGMTNWREDPLSVVRAIHGEALGALDPSKKNGQFGLNPIYGTDAEGNLAIGQLNNRGGMRPVQFPPGFTPREPQKTIDLGTSVVTQGAKSGLPGQALPKDIAGREREEKKGQAQGAAIVDLPRVESNAKSIIEKIEALEKDPNLDSVIGGIQGHMKGWMLTEGQTAAVSRIDELQGGTFLQAFESLKGGGQITEKEGEKATDALNRLRQRGVGEEAYRQALTDFKAEVRRLTELARTKAGGAGAPDAGWRDLGGGVRIRVKP